MLLAVAGLDKSALEQRTRMLASGDWSALPSSHRAALFFARKLSQRPSSITDADIRVLRDRFGPERALDVVWWASRCHYMTRVADGFQLPLERENVFAPPSIAPPPPDAKKP